MTGMKTHDRNDGDGAPLVWQLKPWLSRNDGMKNLFPGKRSCQTRTIVPGKMMINNQFMQPMVVNKKPVNEQMHKIVNHRLYHRRIFVSLPDPGLQTVQYLTGIFRPLCYQLQEKWRKAVLGFFQHVVNGLFFVPVFFA